MSRLTQVTVWTSRKLRLRVKRLSRSEEKTKIIAIVGIAGTTETGNVDELHKIGEICRESGAYFHVDACWGGAAMLVDECRPLFRGIERADSVTVDAHKPAVLPHDHGIGPVPEREGPSGDTAFLPICDPEKLGRYR